MRRLILSLLCFLDIFLEDADANGTKIVDPAGTTTVSVGAGALASTYNGLTLTDTPGTDSCDTSGEAYREYWDTSLNTRCVCNATAWCPVAIGSTCGTASSCG